MISDMDDSDVDDPDAYGYSILAFLKTIVVPYKLRSGKTTTTAKPLPEVKEAVSCPYLTQAKRSPVLVESSKEAACHGPYQGLVGLLQGRKAGPGRPSTQ
ncbi:hypothetical protein DSO57_1030599 [Entomophthora muscae]|uniref:Uncharacterized protein n=1 Tax=Entomophthora muscae TaxID=34485 RepID=A0ACC2T0Y7_9FUNG|nr:hypothetical protein DSO57_1030599 [Entomophthora muscae]